MVNTMDKTTSYGVQDYVCDTADDLTDLPTDVPAGSTAFVIATKVRRYVKQTLDEIEAGREYRITDWVVQEKLPDIPTDAGTYILQAAVDAEGTVIYSWSTK